MLEEKKINSISQFIEIVEDLKTKGAMSNFYFRGHVNSEFELLPQLYRPIIYKDGSKGDLPKYEKEILNEFKKQATRYIESAEKWDYFTTAICGQHYGIQTRLLDWTTNALVALFFACYDPNNSYENCDGMVWILDDCLYYSLYCKLKNMTSREMFNSLIDNKIQSENPTIFTPNDIDARIVSQSSHFMMWGTKRGALNKVIGNQEVLYPITVESSCKSIILKKLDLLGINEASVFPGLNGIGLHIKRIYPFKEK